MPLIRAENILQFFDFIHSEGNQNTKLKKYQIQRYTNSLKSATTKNLITTKLYLHMKAYCQFKRKIKLEILLSVYVRPSVLIHDAMLYVSL